MKKVIIGFIGVMILSSGVVFAQRYDYEKAHREALQQNKQGVNEAKRQLERVKEEDRQREMIRQIQQGQKEQIREYTQPRQY
jgi:hypothetical protein